MHHNLKGPLYHLQQSAKETLSILHKIWLVALCQRPLGEFFKCFDKVRLKFNKTSKPFKNQRKMIWKCPKSLSSLLRSHFNFNWKTSFNQKTLLQINLWSPESFHLIVVWKLAGTWYLWFFASFYQQEWTESEITIFIFLLIYAHEKMQ